MMLDNMTIQEAIFGMAIVFIFWFSFACLNIMYYKKPENKQREEELTIKFNDEYPKLHKQQTATLLGVKLLEENELTIELIEYDCIKSNGEFYGLPRGKLIQLIFLGDKGIPLCTLRSYTSDKLLDYSNKKGKEFKLLRVY